jgi:hypothetical protein
MKKNKFINYVFLIILLSILLCILIFFYIKTRDKETLETKKTIWAMSFGGGNQDYRDAVKRISNEFYETGIFEEILAYTDADLKADSEFWGKHGDFIEKNKRGYGYWLWKPYLIKKVLDKMKENDILFYLDSGCEIKNDGNNKLNKFIELCDDHNILYTTEGYNEKSYTKMDTFSKMNMINDKILNSTQYQAGVLVIKKNEMMTNFINEWYSIGCEYHFIDDSDSILSNDIAFIDNRHDQSIFSLLLKSDKYKNDIYTSNNLITNMYPILTSRKRNG